MALRRLNPSNINYKDRDIGGSVRGGPVAASAPTGGIFASPSAPGDLAPLELEDANIDFTIDDIVEAAAAVSETPEEAEEIIEQYMGEDGDRDTMQQLQDSAAALWRKNNYGSEDAIAPAVGAPKSSAPGSYFQDIPKDVERVAPVEGYMGQNSLTGGDIKAPLKFIPKVATDKLPGEQHPGVDYGLRPLPEKNQGRLATESAKEAETYRGIFGGGSAFNEKWGGTDVYPDPLREVADYETSPTGKKQTDYYNEVYASAKKQGATDVQAKLAASQASLETGYGKSVKGNSHFGIKTGSSYDGDKVDFKTHEIVDGKKVNITDSFRAYKDLDDSVKGYMEFMPNRFPDAWNADSFKEATEGLKAGKRGGYATDPNYNSKLNYITNNFGNSVPVASPQITANPPVDELSHANAVDWSNTPSSVTEAHQQNNDAIAQMQNRDPRTGFDSMATPGVNPSAQPDNMYQGVARPQDFAPEDPYAPRSVTTTPMAPLPPAPHYEQMLDQNILNNNSGSLPGSYYDPSQYAQTTPSGSFNLERESETISGSSGSDLNGGSEGNLDQYQQFMEPSVTMPTYPTGPAAGRGTPQYNGAFEPQNERELTGRSYGFPEVSTPAPAVKASGFAGDNPPVGGGSTTRTEYKSVPVWGYEYNPVTTTIANANQTEYEKAAGLNATVTKEVMEKVPVITGYEKKPYEVKVADATKSQGKDKNQGYQGPQSQQSRTPRYSSKTQAMINAGMAQPAPSGVRQPVDIKGMDVAKAAGMGFLGAGIPGALAGGIFNAGKQALPSITSGYNGIFNGGDTPALSNATQLGGAYDVYNDRSDRNTWAVSNNSGNIVSRDADTGWTGVTSNVNGKGPVTTITLRDGSTAASGFPGFGGGGIFGSSSNEDGADNFTNGSGGTSSYGASGSVNSGGSSSGGGASGGSGSGGGGGFFSDLSDTVSGWFG